MKRKKLYLNLLVGVLVLIQAFSPLLVLASDVMPAILSNEMSTFSTTETESATVVSLVDFTDSEAIKACDGTENGDVQAVCSLRWYNHGDSPTGDAAKGTNTRLRFGTSAGMEFSGKLTNAKTLNMVIDSKAATNITSRIVFWCPKNNGSNSYFYYDFKNDWAGEKEFSIPITDIQGTNSPSWETVGYVEIRSGGNKQTTSSLTDWTISKLEFELDSNSGDTAESSPTVISLVDFTDSEAIKACDGTENGDVQAVCSLRWYNHGDSPTGDAAKGTNTRLRFGTSAGMEFSGKLTNAKTLNMVIDSKAATNITSRIVFWCPKNNGSNSYFYYDFKNDWAGEKEFSIPITDIQGTNSPSWETVGYVEIRSGGNKQTTSSLTDWTISKLEFELADLADDSSEESSDSSEESSDSSEESSDSSEESSDSSEESSDSSEESSDSSEESSDSSEDNSEDSSDVVDSYVINIANFEDTNIIAGYNYTDWGKSEASVTHTTAGHTYSIHWYNHGTTKSENTRLKFTLDTADVGRLNGDASLEMAIYSDTSNNAKMKLLLWCPKVNGSNAYFSKDITVNWTGEKTFSFSLEDLTASGQAEWKNVYYIEILAAGGWSIAGKADTSLYISDMYIQLEKPKTDYPGTLEELYEEETILQTLEVLGNSAAFYVGGTNAATSEGAVALGGTVGLAEETVMIPTSVFATYYGATASDDGINYSITIGEATLSGASGSQICTLNGAEYTLSATPYADNGVVYLPGAEVAGLLGLNACQDGRFLVIGTETAVNALKRKGDIGVNELQEIAEYLSYYTEKNTSTFTEDDYNLFLENWKRKLVGNEEINSQDNELTKALIATIDKNAATAVNLFLGTDSTSTTALFNGVEITTTGQMTATYEHIRAMAMAYATYGSEYYQNTDILATVKYCMQWMYEKYYYVGYTWTPTSNNWWDWGIGSPAHIIDILIVIREHFTAEQITNYLEYFDNKYTKPVSTGANWADFSTQILCSGVLQKNAERAMVGLNAFEKMYLYVDDNERMTESFLDAERAAYTPIKGAGFFTDGSYVYHTLHPMNQTYGITHFASLCNMEMVTAGTVFEINSPQKDNLIEFFFNNMDTTIYDGTTIYRMFYGRHSDAATWTAGTETYARILDCAGSFTEEIREEIYAIVKGAYQLSPESTWNSCLSFEGTMTLKQILDDDSIVPRTERYMNKVYYNQDTVVHEYGDWAIGIQMSSSRIFNYESINNKNMDGWYLADGRTEYLLKDSNLGSTATYWTKINKYRLPGTTVDTQERELVSVKQGNEYLSSKDFVGGTTLNGLYGVAAMELESYHADEPIDGNAGGANPVHTNDLTAKKGYFMFDNGVVCLGTDVNASNNNNAEVLTIVDNKLANAVKSVGPASGSEPYEIVGVEANSVPQEENTPENTLDGSYSTKWAAQMDAEIVWDIGEVKECGFIALAFMSGSKRYQYFELQVSQDGTVWESVFEGQSSGETEELESFDLKAKDARYIKFINKGNSANPTTAWVSLAECQIYPLNEDGSIGITIADKYGSDKFIVDGQSLELLGEAYNLNDATWANVADECGYYFLKENSTDLGNLYAHWTKGSTSFLEMWYSHGVNPDSSSYAYMLLPGMTAEETEQYVSEDSITVLANNSAVQAVYNEKLGITGIIFWEAGTFGKITVDKPCIVMYEDSHFGFNIAVTDPTQKLESLTVTVAEELALVSADECATVLSTATLSEGTTTITLDTLDSVGRTFEVSLVGKPVVSVNGTEGTKDYASLQKAIEAAEEGDTITLLGDVTSEEAIILNKMTLNLNGKTLTVSGLTSFGGDVVDNSDDKTGVLKIDKANCVLSQTNSQMPIYNGAGYVFADIKKQEKDNTVSGSDLFDLIFRPSFGTNNTLLAGGSNATKVSAIIRLTWMEDGEPKTRNLVYTDEMVREVYGDNMAFYIKASGIKSFEGLTITPMVVSDDLKVEWKGSSFTNFTTTK